MIRRLAHQIVLTAAAYSVLSVAASYGQDTIQWSEDLQQARLTASQQNKPLLIHFWTPDCQPCKVVESTVFALPTVARAINDNYVPLKVNANEDEALRAHFKVEGWPTDVVATVDGDELHRMVTEQNANRYIHNLLTVANQNRRAMANPEPFAATVPQPTSKPSESREVTQHQWADGVRPPAVTSNDARARRPGIAAAQRPGVSGEMKAPGYYAMQPPADPDSQPATFGSTANAPDANSKIASQPASSPAPAQISNQYATLGNSPSRYGGLDSSLSGREVKNPYYSNPSVPNSNSSPSPSGSYVPNVRPHSPAPAAATQHAGPVIASNAPPSQNQPASLVNMYAQENQQLNSNRYVGGVTPSPLPSVGLEGRCPVTLLRDGKWRKGNQKWGAVHRGKTYLFAGQEEQQIFLASPDEYSPVLAGIDVVRLADSGRVSEGTRRYGVLYDDDGPGPNSSRIYLFDSVDSRGRFEESPERFIRPVMQAMQSGDLGTRRR